jgi:hypothetical protein
MYTSETPYFQAMAISRIKTRVTVVAVYLAGQVECEWSGS